LSQSGRGPNPQSVRTDGAGQTRIVALGPDDRPISSMRAVSAMAPAAIGPARRVGHGPTGEPGSVVISAAGRLLCESLSSSARTSCQRARNVLRDVADSRRVRPIDRIRPPAIFLVLGKFAGPGRPLDGGRLASARRTTMRSGAAPPVLSTRKSAARKIIKNSEVGSLELAGKPGPLPRLLSLFFASSGPGAAFSKPTARGGPGALPPSFSPADRPTRASETAGPGALSRISSGLQELGKQLIDGSRRDGCSTRPSLLPRAPPDLSPPL
jgi:hypothetical protein